MSTYYDISLSHRVFNEILEAIETATKVTGNFEEIYELVHLYDYLEEEMERSREKFNEETKRWIEQQELFNEKNFDAVFLFNKIKSVLREYEIDLDAEDEFHLICDISEVLKENGKK